MQNDSPQTSRRSFFLAASVAGAAVAAAPLVKGALSTAKVAPAVRPAPLRGGGYLATDHVKRYYETTRV